MIRILITGALGHIGSRFIHDLIPLEFEKVVLVDNLATQRYASLFNLPDGVKFHFIESDIFDADLEALFSDADAVIHLAAVTDATNSFKIQKEVERINHEGTRKVAEACIRTKRPMIFISSTSVYGTQSGVVDESCPVAELRPQSPYAEAKLKTEGMLSTFGKEEGLRFIICRFGTVYGVSPGMRFHTAVNKFIWQACSGRPITVWRTAIDQKRPYLDVADAVGALRFILDRGLFDNQIYNVLTSNATVREIVDSIQLYVRECRIEYVDKRIMNQLSYHVLNDKFRSLGFEFRGSLPEGIRQTVDLLSNISANVSSGPDVHS